MWYDQAEWVGIHNIIDLEIEPNKEINAFVFYCFDNLSIGHNFRMMTCPILMGFSAKW